jgi:outer membrane receptor protein involved in Fe transport
VPEYKISFGIDYDHPLGFFTSINGRKLGPWYMDDENEREYNGYFLADCKVGYKTNIKKSKIYWSLGCNNIFDKKYAASCYTSGTSNKYYPGMPRYFYTEIKIEF